MRLILVRHADREHLPSVADREQILTPKGEVTARLLGEHLASLNLPSSAPIYSSDYARALQTAQIIKVAMGNQAPLQSVECLRPEPEGSVKEILEIVKSQAAQDFLLLVGHQPEFEQLGAYLLGRPLTLKKAEAACLLVAAKSKIEWRYHAQA